MLRRFVSRMTEQQSKTLLFSLFLIIVPSESYTPVVIWHGIGDTCCNTTITGRLQTLLSEYLPGIHVLSLQIGKSTGEDFINSFIMHPDKQIELACKMIRADGLLAEGYNAVGFSQGSQLLRGVAQRCPEPRMKTLITMAGQHQGVYGIPRCDALSNPRCEFYRRMANTIMYFRNVQKMLVPATYWHDPFNTTVYAMGSTYLADINNENTINESYIQNLQALEKFVMVKHEADEMVQPIESSWFGFYKGGQDKETETLQESELYKANRLGLKQMDGDGKLHFLENTWHHADFEWSWFKKNIVDVYLID